MVLSREDFKSLLIPVPPKDEQIRIANFLDRETAKIDELIQKQEKLIELLEEKRKSVIGSVITKGLSADNVFKESNIQWIGKVPNYWTIGKVKNYFQVTLGKMLQPEKKRDTDRLVRYLRAANIQLSGADTTDVKEMWLSENELKELRLIDGDILVSEGGDVGRCCIWKSELEECYFQNSINRVRPIGNQLNKFFYYWMTFAKNSGYIDILCNKSTIAHLTAEKLSALPMVFPPIGEQIEIANYLDSMFLKFDLLISKSELSIAFLKEHRSSLISAAVTGKIDVRELT
jgi:type I restriction enzyme S subunit